MKSFIIGLEKTILTDNEISFIKEYLPWGIILFSRNCDNPDQLKSLTNELKNIYGTEEVPILIDQEGGRVQRLKGGGWLNYHSPAFFYDLYRQMPDEAIDLIRLNASVQASELKRMGINVNCAPVLDINYDYADDIIGDRAFSNNPDEVVKYGDAVIKGLMDGGVLPVVKHIPGHGRANCDSHLDLPVVGGTIKEISRDFLPFKNLDYPLAMTAHILYEDLDPKHCATLSSSIIKNVIRGIIGFSGLLMSDDISMKALDGDLSSLTKNILSSGCDLVLHCNGDFDQMCKIAEVIPDSCSMLAHRTEAIFNDLFLKSSPRSLEDLLEEYSELQVKLTSRIINKSVA